VLVLAYRDHGIRRDVGVLVIAAYLVFAGSLLASADAPQLQAPIAAGGGAVVAVVFAARLVLGRRLGRGEPETTPALLLPGRDPVGQFCGRLPEAPGSGRVRPGGLPGISQGPRAGPERGRPARGECREHLTYTARTRRYGPIETAHLRAAGRALPGLTTL